MSTVLAHVYLDALPSAPEPIPGTVLSRWIQIFPMGVPAMNDDRKMKVAEEDMAAMLRSFAKKKNKIAILFEHGRGPRGGAAAGWLNNMEVRKDGLYGLVTWNTETALSIRRGEWKYISPGFLALQDSEGFWRPRVIREVSLTNIPAIDGMRPVEAEVEADLVLFADELIEELNMKTSVTNTTNPAPAPPPEPKKEEQMDLKKINTLLGLAETATEEEATVAIGGLKKCEAELAELKAKPKVEIVPETKPADPAPPAKTEAEIRAEAIAEATAAAEKKVADEKRAELVKMTLEANVANGKIVPAKRDAYEKAIAACPEEMQSILADIKPTAPVKPTTSGNLVPVDLEQKTVSYDKAAKVANMLHISIAEATRVLSAAAKAQ